VLVVDIATIGADGGDKVVITKFALHNLFESIDTK
jgi:hypothetical protein